MLSAKELQRLHDAFATVQKCVYDYEGTINKFLVDDKGSTVIAAFGLPPVTHENDPIRGILASLAICAALGNTGLKASVGITTGTALCGVVGHQGNRREYTVLGDIVNLSARLMQRAKSEGGGVITDAPTKIYTHDVLHFEKRPEIMVKGKNESIKIHRPYPRMSILLDYHLSSAIQQSSRKTKFNSIMGRAGRANALSVVSRAVPMQNLMENMHRVQVRDAQRRLSLRADRQRLQAEELVESESFVEVRAALMDKCSHLNPFAPGGAFILEGDIGVGKTVLLRSALASPEAGDYQVLVGTASPFSTKKPYAIWSELVTRGAIDISGNRVNPCVEPAPPLSPEVASTSSSCPVVPVASKGVETMRRECVAQFVRKKISEGAAPNTTLVRYASLLNTILDTDFDAYPDANDDDTEDLRKTITPDCNESESSCQEYGTTNQSEDEMSEESQRQNEDEMRACGYAFAESPDRTLNVKEGEIASWFLGLLEMDLAQKEEARVSLGDSTYLDTNTPRQEVVDEEADESDWKPADLDISGILLLCALYAMSRERATVFCLDSAMYMDGKSWTLVAIIVKYFTNCLIVVGTRPPSLALGENTESSSFRKQLRLLKRMKSSTYACLDTFSSDEIEVLSRQILKVPSIPRNLLAILVSRSQGNPLFLHEIIAEMQEQQVIKVDEKRGARRCELHVQESWGDKSKAEFCFACHTRFKKEKKPQEKERENDMNKGKDVEVKKSKHRCKCCGYIFCAECTPKACRTKLPGKSNEPVRHCRMCYNIASSRRPSGSSHGIGAAVGSINDKRARPKGRFRAMFQSGSAGDPISLSASSKPPPASCAQTLTNRIALRPPRTVKSVLTTMLDQLTVSQRMLMKTASAIGPIFDKETLRSTCPIEAHLSRFAQDLEDLEQLAMIRRIDTFIGGVPATSIQSSGSTGAILTISQTAPPSSHVKVKFEFNHGFMCGVIREQMLRGQLDKLNARIADFREQQQKEFRQKFISKASESLARPVLLNTSAFHPDGDAILQGSRRAHTPTGAGMGNSRSSAFSSARQQRLQLRRNSLSGIESVGVDRSHHGGVSSDTRSASSDSSSESSSTQAVLESEHEDGLSPIVSPHNASVVSLLSSNNTMFALPTFTRLKAGRVLVKKYCSMFSHLKLKGLKNARQWKTRYAVLQNARLLLQYEEGESGKDSCKSPAQQLQCMWHGTVLSLKGAKVSACDPEVATKVNCFQVEVAEWTKKGKLVKNQRRSFVIGVESEDEVEDWVYMIRFAIESLESQPVSPQL
ncbi:unnamed protein product [Phytophthora fragariaefolia]|uniref:Unnamed protein product n=1 Tax=Phytophthora fragariaefolia TaxID=1490495 RepID=A0A9W7D3N9_9STRA|nr:unnamed protein product [Phytophthora fragariaefolia]